VLGDGLDEVGLSIRSTRGRSRAYRPYRLAVDPQLTGYGALGPAEFEKRPDLVLRRLFPALYIRWLVFNPIFAVAGFA